MNHALGLTVTARAMSRRAARASDRTKTRPRFVFGKGEAVKERKRMERNDEIKKLKEILGASIEEGEILRTEAKRTLAALEDARAELKLATARASSQAPPATGSSKEPEFDGGECIVGQFSSCDARQIAQQTSMTFLAVVALLLEQDLSNTAVSDIRNLMIGGDGGDPFSIFLRFGVPMAFGFLAYFFKKLTDLGHLKINM